MKIFRMIFLLLSIAAFGQKEVKMRDLSFKVPGQWHIMDKAAYEKSFGTLNFKGFYQAGAVFSGDMESVNLPVIKYQYYEIPGLEARHPDSIFRQQENTLRKDFTMDSVVAVKKKNYMYTSISAGGTHLLYGYSMGSKGVLHLQMTVDKEKPEKSLTIFKIIMESVQHSIPYTYNNKYEDSKQEGAESSKRLFIFGAVGLVVLLIGSRLKKTRT